MNSNKIKLLVLDVDGTMTDGGIYVLDDGSQFKKFNAKDGLGIKLAMQAGIDVGIISHSHSEQMVNSRANMLGMKYIYVGQESKIIILQQWLKKLNIELHEVAFIGDDINDLSIIEAVGHSACPADSSEKVKEKVNVILEKKGGFGAVREYIDQYLLP